MTDKKTTSPLAEWLGKHALEISMAVVMTGGLGYAMWTMASEIDARDAAIRSEMMSLTPAMIVAEDVTDATSKIPEGKQAKSLVVVRGPEFEHDRLWLGCARYDAGLEAYGILRSETDVLDWDNHGSLKIDRDDTKTSDFRGEMDAVCGRAGEILQT